jgi:hypothetical protein
MGDQGYRKWYAPQGNEGLNDVKPFVNGRSRQLIGPCRAATDTRGGS